MSKAEEPRCWRVQVNKRGDLYLGQPRMDFETVEVVDIAALEAAEAENERLRGLQEPLAKQRLQAARAEIERLREVLHAALGWRGLDGDGITDPVRQQLIGAAPAPKPIVVGGNTKHCDDCGRHPDRCTCHKPQTQREET